MSTVKADTFFPTAWKWVSKCAMRQSFFTSSHSITCAIDGETKGDEGGDEGRREEEVRRGGEKRRQGEKKKKKRKRRRRRGRDGEEIIEKYKDESPKESYMYSL